MGLFSKGLKQLESVASTEQNEQSNESLNISKVTADKAVDIIKQLSGVSNDTGKKIIDNVICITNSAGGAGASTIASNVAYLSYKKGLNVLLIDLNIMYPSLHMSLGIEQELVKSDLVSFLLGEDTLNNCIDSTKDISLLFANNRNLSHYINCNSKTAVDNFKELISKVRSYYDLVIIDCPMRIDSMLENTALYLSDSIYVIWEEGVCSVVNTGKIRNNMAVTGIDSFTKMRVVLNKRTSVHFSDYPLKKLNIELTEIIPFDVDMIDNSSRCRIFCDKGSVTSKNSKEIVRKLNSLTDKILKIGGYVD